MALRMRHCVIEGLFFLFQNENNFNPTTTEGLPKKTHPFSCTFNICRFSSLSSCCLRCCQFIYGVDCDVEFVDDILVKTGVDLLGNASKTLNPMLANKRLCRWIRKIWNNFRKQFLFEFWNIVAKILKMTVLML